MPRGCTICAHPDRAAIETALVAGTPFRDIAGQFQVTRSSLARHKQEHLPEVLAHGNARKVSGHAKAGQAVVPKHAPALAQQVAQRESAAALHAIDIMAQVQQLFSRINLLFDACDRWLRDVDDNTQYDLGPRANEVKVTYLVTQGDKLVRRKEKLSALLRLLVASGVAVDGAEYKHADVRELVLKTAAQLQSQIEMLTTVMDKLRSQQQMERWQAAVLEAIGEADSATRDRIFDRLRQVHSNLIALS